MNDGPLACHLAWQFPYSVQAAIRRYVMSRVIGNSLVQMVQSCLIKWLTVNPHRNLSYKNANGKSTRKCKLFQEELIPSHVFNFRYKNGIFYNQNNFIPFIVFDCSKSIGQGTWIGEVEGALEEGKVAMLWSLLREGNQLLGKCCMHASSLVYAALVPPIVGGNN